MRVEHPNDRWVEVTALGAPFPQFILAVDGREVDIAKARAQYIFGVIEIEEFERIVSGALGLPRRSLFA